MLTQLTSSEQEIVHSNSGMLRYLESLLKGRAPTPRSWLYEDHTTDWILDTWMRRLSSLQDGTTYEQEVFQFDTSQTKKWGPQGGIAPISELSAIVTDGFGPSPYPKAYRSSRWENAKLRVIADFRARGITGLRPASYKHVIDDMRARDTLESNSGWPLFTKRSKPEVKESSIRDAENGTWKDYPAIALFRNYNQKTRLVWMYPMATNLVEGSFMQPLQSAIIKKAIPFFTPWEGFESVRKQIGNAYATGRVVAASDFTSTDAHFNVWATQQVFDVIKWCFQTRYWNALNESMVHMNLIPLVVSPTTKLVGSHGVSSGSNWTNFVETIFDRIFSYYVSDTTNYYGLSAIGDDMSWVAVRHLKSFSPKLERLGESVGQVVKAEKTTNDAVKVKYLQRLFQRGYSRPDGLIRAVYPTIRALNSSVNPERFHDPRRWSSDMFCARQFMILENCVDHPLFEEFVKFVCYGQRDLIPFAKNSKSELDRILGETKLLPGLNPTYNQERRDRSFAEFESIRIASRLR